MKIHPQFSFDVGKSHAKSAISSVAASFMAADGKASISRDNLKDAAAMVAIADLGRCSVHYRWGWAVACAEARRL